MEEEWDIIPPDEDEWQLEDSYDPNLASVRSSFEPELEDPQVRELLAASTKAEVGDQPPHVQQSYMETVLNRAKARNQSVADTVLDPGYYPSITHWRMASKMGNFQDEEMQQLDKMIENVVKGSNITNYATGNESGNVHSGGAQVSYNPGTGERFVQENADQDWVNKTAGDGKEDWEIILPSTKGKLTEAQPKDEEWEIIPPSGKKSFYATDEEEKKWGGRGPADPTRMAEEAAQFDTKLTKNEEVDFQKWKAKYAPKDSGFDYDLRGAFKAGFTPDPKTGHWLDKFKKPNHPTFSDQSQYATGEYAKKAGHWEGDKFVPPTAFQSKQSPEELIDHVETGINAGKEIWESAKRGFMSSGLGLGETINRYAYSPIVHGIREAIDYVAPGSDLAKTAKYVDDEFYKHTVEIPAAQREQLGKESAKAGAVSEVAHAVGQMAGDLPSIMLTSGLLPELKTGMELVNSLRHGAAAMTVPAMRAGTDAAEQVKKDGGTEMEQFGAFVRGTTLMMGIGAVPMATQSGAPSVLGRVAERAVKSVPLASAAVESARMADNLVSDIFGGEKHPFSLEEHLKGVLPMAILGGVAGRSTAKSKFEKTFGFNERSLDKADFMRRRMEVEGIAKATPEKVMEWDAQWKKAQSEWPEEAPPATPEAETPGVTPDESFAPKEAAPVTPEAPPFVEHLRDIAEGKPVEVFHGSRKPNLEEASPRSSFTTSPELAKKFAGKSGEVYSGEIVIPPDNPIRWNAEHYLKEIQEGKITPEEAEKAFRSRVNEVKPEGPVSVKRSTQALGIVADPRATKGFEAAKEEAKAIADYLNKAEHWGPWNSAVGNKVAFDQKNYDNVTKQAEAFKKLAPDEQARKGVTMHIEAGGDMKKIVGWGANVKDKAAKAAYRAAGALKPNELALAQKIKDRYQALNMLLNAHGIDVAEIENYITHMFHTSGSVEPTGRPMRSVSSFFRFAKPRHYDSYFAAIQAGEKPKSFDAVDILSAYEIQAMRAIGNKKFVDRLKYGQARDGRPIVAPSSVKFLPEGQGYEPIHAGGLEHSVVHPDYHGDLSNILGTSRIQKWLEQRGRNPFANYGKGALQAVIEGQKYAKGTMFSLSLFHQGTEGLHGFGHRINSFNTAIKRIDLNDPRQYDAAVHGLMLRPDKASQEQFMTGVGGKTNYNLVTKVSRKFGGEAGRQMANLIDGYSHYLFEDYIPRLKMDTYEQILRRNTHLFAKDLASGKVSPSEIKSLSADQANAAYGHLNYTKMARSPTIQQALQIMLLAPDFFEARARFAWQAIKGLAGSKTGTEQLVALALLGAGQYVAARILNKLDHDDYEWDLEHAFQLKTDLGGLLPADRWIGLRSVPEDMHKAGLTSLVTGHPYKAVDEFTQFMRHRLSPTFGLLADNISKTNWRGEKTDFGKSIGDLLSNVVPMPLQGYMENITRPNKAQSISPFETLLKSTGIQIHRVSPLSDTHELAKDWLKVNDPEEYTRREASSFPASRYLTLRYALEDSDQEAARAEVKRLKETKDGFAGKNFQESILHTFTRSLASDQEFYDSLDKHDQAIFKAALERRSLILNRYKKWVGPLGTTTNVSVPGLQRRMREAKVEEAKQARKRR